jgi:GT2 family glycosyltransferase
MELSIIIVNWNSLAYLRDCLISVYQHLQDVSFEVIVVDNASPDGDIDSLKPEFPDIALIKSAANLGFAGANNVGFKTSRGEYVLFLNPDTQLVDNAIKTLLEQSKLLPDAGVVGCKLLNTDSSVQTNCIQKFPTIPNQLLDFEYLRLRWPNSSLWGIGPLFSESDKPVSVEIISGACMLLKREVFERAGMFTEDYFMYAEDLDLCYKVRRLGLENYYVGNAHIIHHGGRSSNQVTVNHWSVIMRFKAVQLFCAKRQGPLYGWLYRTAMGCVALGRLFLLSLAKLLGSTDSRKLEVKHASSKWFAVLKWSCGVGGDRLRTATNR